MWMLPLYLHVNQKSDYDDDDMSKLQMQIIFFFFFFFSQGLPFAIEVHGNLQYCKMLTLNLLVQTFKMGKFTGIS